MSDYTIAEVQALLDEKIKGAVDTFVQKLVELRQRELSKAEGIHEEPGTHEAGEMGVQPHTEPGQHEQFAISRVQHEAPNPVGSAQEPVEADAEKHHMPDLCPICHQEDVPGSCTCLNEMAKAELEKGNCSYPACGAPTKGTFCGTHSGKKPVQKATDEDGFPVGAKVSGEERKAAREKTLKEIQAPKPAPTTKAEANRQMEKSIVLSEEKDPKKAREHKRLRTKGEFGEAHKIKEKAPSRLASKKKNLRKEMGIGESVVGNGPQVIPEGPNEGVSSNLMSSEKGELPVGKIASKPPAEDANSGPAKKVAKAEPLAKPSVSGKQHRAMEAAKHGHSTLGIPKDVGADFVAADKGKHFDKSAGVNPVGGGSQNSNSRSDMGNAGSPVSGVPSNGGEIMANSEKMEKPVGKPLCKLCKSAMCKCSMGKAEEKHEHVADPSKAGTINHYDQYPSEGRTTKLERCKCGAERKAGGDWKPNPIKKGETFNETGAKAASEVEHQDEVGEVSGRGPLDKKPEEMSTDSVGNDAEESSSPIGGHDAPDRGHEEKPDMKVDIKDPAPGIEWKKSEGGSMYGMVGQHRYRISKAGDGFVVYHNGNRISEMAKSEDALFKANEHFARRAVIEKAFYKHLSPMVGRGPGYGPGKFPELEPKPTTKPAEVTKFPAKASSLKAPSHPEKKSEPSPLDETKPEVAAPAAKTEASGVPDKKGEAKNPGIVGTKLAGGKSAGVVGTPKLSGEKAPAEVSGVPQKAGKNGAEPSGTPDKKGEGKNPGIVGTKLGKDEVAGVPQKSGPVVKEVAGVPQKNGPVVKEVASVPQKNGPVVKEVAGVPQKSGKLGKGLLPMSATKQAAAASNNMSGPHNDIGGAISAPPGMKKGLPGKGKLPAVAPKQPPVHAGGMTGAAKIGAVAAQPIAPMAAKPGMSLKAPAHPAPAAPVHQMTNAKRAGGTGALLGKSELGNCLLCSKAEHAGACN